MSITRRDFLKGAAATTAAATVAASVAVADEPAAKAPVFDDYDLFAESRVVWQDIPADQIAGTYDYDFVVIGGGIGGTTAALAAGCKGAGKVALLQNAYACIAGGMGGCGIDLSESDHLGLARYKQQWNEQNLFRGDQHLIDNLLYYSGEAADFIVSIASDEAGVAPSSYRGRAMEFEDGHHVLSKTLQYGPKPHGFVDACNAMASVAANHNVDVYFGMPGVKLIQDETGRVIAAIGKSLDDDKYYRFNASKGILLACGTFHNNTAMLARYCSDVVGFDSKVQGYFGDGHLMGMLAGGVMRNGAHSKMVHDNDSPLQDAPFLAVNDNGERFMNEECENSYANNVLKDQPHKGWWCSLFDADYEAQCASWGQELSAWDALDQFMPGTPENLALGVFAQECHTYKCDTLEELAEKLGIPFEPMKASIDRYNELVELGEDLDFGKKTKYLAPVKNPPFYGVHRHVRISAILSGLDVDKYMRVLDKDKQPIAGLYACGNNAGTVCGASEWNQVSGGASIGNAFTGGYVAALHVAGLIGE